jgi:hypothetical protein
MIDIDKTKNKISFHFQPYEFDQKNHYVEKEDKEGRLRKYIIGISSGLKIDGHEERMTEKCIKSFMNQSSTGDILLYPDIHGIEASNDIGILNSAKVLDNGDWYTEYRLYDEFDNVGPIKLEKIDTIWKQQTGAPPYNYPKQKGMSIEGFIPPGAIIGGEQAEDGSIQKKVIDDVILDGVVLVPRPAYADSVATACYKALGELPPAFRQNLKKSIKNELKNRLDEEELNDIYYRKKYDLQDALDTQIEKIMKRQKDSRKKEKIEILFDEYKELMVEIIMNSENLFMNNEGEGENNDQDDEVYDLEVKKDSKVLELKTMYDQLKEIRKRLN